MTTHTIFYNKSHVDVELFNGAAPKPFACILAGGNAAAGMPPGLTVVARDTSPEATVRFKFYVGAVVQPSYDIVFMSSPAETKRFMARPPLNEKGEHCLTIVNNTPVLLTMAIRYGGDANASLQQIERFFFRERLTSADGCRWPCKRWGKRSIFLGYGCSHHCIYAR